MEVAHLMAQAERAAPSSNDAAYCIGLLWSEIPLDKERHVLDRLRREGSYDTWEWALDYPLDGGPTGDCPGGLGWDSCHADDCGVREDGTGCALGSALAAHAADMRAGYDVVAKADLG